MFALLSVVVFLSVTHRRAEGRALVCNTEDCRAHAKLLTQHLNTKLSPCDDFKAFVCSAARSSSEHSEIFKTVLDGLRLSWYQRLRDILTSGTTKIGIGKKALAMHQMCLEQYPRDAADLPLFLHFLQDQGLNWPEPPRSYEPPLQFIIKLAYLWQSPFWMSVTVQVSDSSSPTTTRFRFQIRPSLLVPILLYHHRIAKSAYTKYWGQFLSHMYPDRATRPALNETAIAEVRDMEEYILETLTSVGKSPIPKPAVFPLAELSAHVPNASAHNWIEGFQQSIPLGRNVSPDDEIAVNDVRLLMTISELLQKYNEAQINMHLTWLVVQYYAPVADYRMLVDHYGNANKAAAYLPVFCGHQVEASFKVLVLALDVASRFTARDVKTINDGLEDLTSTALERVNVSDWMDDESKARLSEKIAALKKSLWPPDAVLNESTLQSVYGTFPDNKTSFAAQWMMTRLAVSMVQMTGQYEEAMRLPWNSLPGYVFYDYISNAVGLATGTIAAPVYYPNGAKAMLYGGLLFLVATRLVRAFDSEGVTWAPNGTKVDSILSNATMFEYRERERCLVNDTSERSLFPEVPAYAIAYTAMKRAHIRDGSEPLGLGADLSEDKAFFMTLCYVLCPTSGDERGRDLDCNKVARNSKAFAKAFQCPKGTKMNPEKKCRFFIR